VSVVWIYTIANEIVNLLTAFGVILNISNTILGLTFLAWGNSLSDYVADIVTAKQGYPNMAMAACFGGPLFNILLGVGIPFTVKCIRLKDGFTIKKSLLQDVLALFLGVSLVSTLIYIPLNKFNFTRRYGYYLIGLYAIALTFCILIEAGVIKHSS
jgi:solute carrier family 24 (sodium/potassium/calcium exchanger), member 6